LLFEKTKEENFHISNSVKVAIIVTNVFFWQILALWQQKKTSLNCTSVMFISFLIGAHTNP
jgi:hypothetical protein